MKVLRPHQDLAIVQLRGSMRSGKRRPVLRLSTGSGKTLIAAKIIANAIAKGKRVLFVVDAIELIDQTVAAFYSEGLYGIGVIQAQHPMTDYSRPIQIASVQTLARRPCPPFDLCIIDECHSRFKAHEKLMTDNPDTPFVGLSATPWAKGMGLWFDDLIQPASIRELTDLGYVAKLEAYAPGHPDLSDVKVRAGEYDDNALSLVMRGEKLIADIVQTWKDLGQGRPTLCFCVDLAHAEAMRDRFERSGVSAAYIDGDTEVLDRKAIRARLDAGEVKVVVSVGTMIKGVDWKFGTIIDAQPTKSRMRHVQKLGRLRPFPEWPTAIVLDHSDNILRLGLPIDIHCDTLDTSKKGEAPTSQPETKVVQKGCPRCSAVKPAGTKVCPSCGFENKRHSDIEEASGALQLVGGDKAGPSTKKREPTREEKQAFWSMALHVDQQRQKGGKLAASLYKAKFSVWPRGMMDSPVKPDGAFLSYEHSRRIAFAKSKGRKVA